MNPFTALKNFSPFNFISLYFFSHFSYQPFTSLYFTYGLVGYEFSFNFVDRHQITVVILRVEEGSMIKHKFGVNLWPNLSTPEMEVVCAFETPTSTYMITPCYNHKDHNLKKQWLPNEGKESDYWGELKKNKVCVKSFKSLVKGSEVKII